uniref:Tyrosine-protein kinase n=1 Tax=Panagrellus redivivus TaxID=6233 RepID=A0A7E4V8U6_PANRE
MSSEDNNLANNDVDGFRALHQQQWYHGLRSRADVTPLFEHKGDFLTRTCRHDDRIEVILSVCVEPAKSSTPPKVVHLSLFCHPNLKTWDLAVLKKRARSQRGGGGAAAAQCTNRFETVSALIAYYKSHAVLGEVKLNRGIPRPSWIIPTSFLTYHESKGFLGKGNFAKVIKGKLLMRSRSHRVTVAIKMLLEDTDMSQQDRDKGRDILMQEAKVMSRYFHKNIIEFYGVACEKPPIMIVMEFCPGSSLEPHLRNYADDITPGERVLFLIEAARGMRYLHHHSCIHRDLASRNCLISKNGVIKIADFGLSKITDKNDIGKSETDIPQNVPLRWMAPETISRTPRYSTKSDVWAFGVLVYEVFNDGVKPWAEADDYKMISQCIRKGKMPAPPPKSVPEIANLMTLCWNLLMDDRPEFRQIVKILSEMQKDNPKLSKPAAKDCTTNRIQDVVRIDENESIDDILAEKSLDITGNSMCESRESSEELLARRKSLGSNRSTSAPRVRSQYVPAGMNRDIDK